MFKSYLKTASRNLSRNKTFAAINISGLAVGITASLLLFIVIRYELSYDKFQPDYRRIFHVVTKTESAEGTGYQEGIPFPGYDALRAQSPDIPIAAIYQNYQSQVMVLSSGDAASPDNKKFLEE